MSLLRYFLIATLFTFLLSCDSSNSGDMTIKTALVEQINPNKVRISGEILNALELPVDRVGITVGKENNEGLLQIVSYNDEVSDKYTILIQSLLPNTKYYAKAFLSQEDTIIYGNVIEFETSGFSPNATLQPSHWSLNESEIYGKIFYDKQKVVEVKTYTSFALDYWDSSVRFTYNDDGKIATVESDADGAGSEKTNYIYVDGRLDSTYNVLYGSKLSRKYHYSNNDVCSIDSIFEYDDGDIYEKYGFEYLDGNCSYIFKSDNNESTVYYDDQRTFFQYGFRNNFGQGGLQSSNSYHNVTEYKRNYFSSDNVDKNRSYTSTFEFMDNGYPIKEFRTYLNGNELEYTFYYNQL
ncbi:MAG: hypothetical protein P1U56_04040 [Saprospiraceae bacterium]|nr:hypothetical protein [Saprospiraceae bacterium]